MALNMSNPDAKQLRTFFRILILLYSLNILKFPEKLLSICSDSS